MAKGKKTVGVLGAAVLGMSLGSAVDAQAFQRAVDSGSKQALEQFLQQYPTSEYAVEAVDRLIGGTYAVQTDAAGADDLELGISGY